MAKPAHRMLLPIAAATLACGSWALAADDAARRPAQPPDAQMKAVLDQLAALNPQPIEALSPEEARKQPTPADAVKKLVKQQDVDAKPRKVDDVDNEKITGPGGRIPLRVYQPAGDGPFPVIVYYHGGGFVIATIDTYDASCRALANLTNAVVVAVEYRKAPEYKYPAAVDDAFAAYQYVRQNAKEFNGDPNRVAVAGESAGGNLATVTCMKAKEAGAPMPVFQLLVYPFVDNDMTAPSVETYADAKPLNKAMLGWFAHHYLDNPDSAKDPHVLPLKATADQLRGLPPAMVLTAEIDPLKTQGKQYADKLKEAGVPVQYKHYDGVTHEFFGMGLVVDKAKQAEQDAADALKAAFAAGGGSSRTADPNR